MLRVDYAIINVNKNISKNISIFDSSERGLLSQNILAQLRNLVEYIALKIYANGRDLAPNDYNLNREGLKFISSKSKFRFLKRFHDLLQKSASHYTLDENASERLMLKYYENLLEIKIFLENEYKLQVFENIDEFPLNLDTELVNYYEKIVEKISTPSKTIRKIPYSDRCYIQKIKPIFINKKIYYEVTFTIANSKTSKFDRVIAFTKHRILDNYSVKLSIHSDSIDILGKKMDIQIIDNYEVSIRPCELNNFSAIFGIDLNIKSGEKEYIKLMEFLTYSQMPLSELILCSGEQYNSIKEKITISERRYHIFDVLDKTRSIILNKKPGFNIILYLLYQLRNKVIKYQKARYTCPKLSDLYLEYGCIPFDKMPFCSSLLNHNPKIYELLECLPSKDREHEFFARYIKNNIELKSMLFTEEKSIKNFQNINELIEKYNNNLYLPKHSNRMLAKFKNHIYMKGYAEDNAFIIKELNKYTSKGINQYKESVESWIQQNLYIIDDENKKEILKNLFDKSEVAFIYGAAGTGKSTLINHIANFLVDKNKIFLANTHPAVDNLRKKVSANNSNFSTIAGLLSKGSTECDILIIDECSTIDNSDMKKILEKVSFKLLVLVGDIHQIESIYFGNWFNIICNFVSKNFVFELTEPFRTKNENLLTVWKQVRERDFAILEPLVKNNYSVKLDETIFSIEDRDEIILCLNYDGLYGINNINRFLQNINYHQAIPWGINVYKVQDPILFNESDRFSPLIHNNSKGRIVEINVEREKIWFSIELDFVINELDAFGYDFELLGLSKNGNSIIKFSVDRYKSTDEDDDYLNTVVPFQVAYAISIHKAQGLEYNSVKIVITNEIEERITHNIFYTAITRAKEKLKIYWSPETEKEVLSRLNSKNNSEKKDKYLLSALYSLEIKNKS